MFKKPCFSTTRINLNIYFPWKRKGGKYLVFRVENNQANERTADQKDYWSRIIKKTEGPQQSQWLRLLYQTILHVTNLIWIHFPELWGEVGQT